MIQKTRRNFILVTMALIAAVMICFVVATVVTTHSRSESDAFKMLRGSLDVKDHGGWRPESGRIVNIVCKYKPSGALDEVDYGDAVLLKIFQSDKAVSDFLNCVIVDGNVVGKNIVEGNITLGKCGNYYYAAKVNQTELTVTIAVGNRQNEARTIGRFALTLCLFAVAALFVLFWIVWWLSYKVVKPVEVAFNKQKQFISDASHELKTPITIIKANAEALEADCGSSEWSQNIVQQSERMSLLVAEMLTLAHMEERKPTYSLCDVSQIVESVALEFEPLAFENGKKLDIDVEQNVSLTTDADGIRRVTMLITDNAVKYSATFVSLSLKKVGKNVVLRVVNDGCNVPAEHKEKIFERFFREDDSRARETGGNGLGLATVKRIAESNGWQISVQCERDGNMDISVCLGRMPQKND